MTVRQKSFLALALLVPAPSIGAAVVMGIAPGPLGQAVYALLKVWLLLLPLYWMRRVERAGFGLSPARRGGFLFGLLSGALMGAAILVAYALVGSGWIDVEHFRERAFQNGLSTSMRFVAFALFGALLNSLLEEYVWRWFVFRRCEDLLPRAAAVAASALFFTAHHVIALRLQFGWAVTLLASLGIFINGAVWSFTYLRYRSIWPGYLSHVVVDLVILGLGWKLLFG